MGIDAKMLIKINRQTTDEELKKWSYLFGSAFHCDLFLGIRDEIWYHPLEKIDHYIQDGPDILPKDDETFLRVPLSGRYYGKGYERGPLMTYIQMAEFLELLIPDCEIYYGGDSSGVCAEPFDKIERTLLMKHFIEHEGHRHYTSYFDRENDGPICPVCDVKMVRNGWGRDYKAFSCSGCGWNHTERGNEITRGFTNG